VVVAYFGALSQRIYGETEKKTRGTSGWSMSGLMFDPVTVPNEKQACYPLDTVVPYKMVSRETGREGVDWI
jgi:hypothetical protein